MGVGKPGKSLDEDARPIVSGETWRKLAFKCTLSSDRAGVTEHLKPNQLSVGVASGVETIIHSSRKCGQDHTKDPDAVFLERDCENAFNGTDPSEFLQDCAEHMPNSARFAEWCYGTKVNVVYRGKVESSCRGQQGCPAMGPMFCLMRKCMATRTHSEMDNSPSFETEFEEDSHIGGNANAVLQCFRT